MWNERYDRPDYLFGKEPAGFLEAHAHVLSRNSRVLCIADGEGRNSVYLARLGHRVTAFDGSHVAIEKARRLAADRGVEVDFREADVDGWDWTPDSWDAVVAIFIQFADPAMRKRIFDGIAQTLRPGGHLLLHGYAPRQVDYGTGGPSNPDNMYTVPMLEDAFPGWHVFDKADYDARIDEGEGHSGRSALVDFVAMKPAG
ncbi:class I SAM-dependent methyltransferase [Tropicimonas isoalkanivorans]|uniref:Methyltransferase domain-containing protein n=1 Tax=Tropicimonas isoalkanivorans TaxID=441112 RepID=A0A1I1GLF2_9RHOB|nr:class I SAM-dependent methyltransferase [Tropicimonas isoalkanivorans]SFC12321.1 Methyltransferase domain-containing protein [Tropicimonas isoalkanivorans]